MSKIKICGLSRDDDVDYINEAKPDFTGFIIGVPKSKRNIDRSTAGRLKSRLDKNIPAVGVFIDYPLEKIAQLCNDGIIDIVQLHGNESENYIKELRGLISDNEIWKAFVISNLDDVKRAEQCSADRILLDSGTGSGKTFDWSIAANTTREIILAGGLNPKNIPLAIKQINPWAVDLSSGVETDGVKDKDKILAAVAAVRSTDYK